MPLSSPRGRMAQAQMRRPHQSVAQTRCRSLDGDPQGSSHLLEPILLLGAQ